VSGHSKWATIKHKKAAVDKARGKLFNKLARQIEVAAREGGGDVTANATLRTMVSKAKQAQMTNDAIDRAIKRGTGEETGVTYEAITYEGYAPGGVAVLVEVLTDNRNRTGSDVRSIFSKMGGSMAEPGAVAWQFSRAGLVWVDRAANEDDVMLVALEAGATDVTDDDDAWKITCAPNEVEEVRAALEGAGIPVVEAESTMVSSVVVSVTDPEDAKKVLRILDAFEENDDVQEVYSNVDIPAELLEAVS
jgi:YebC/PmpR family DNA-binding regulatory protein